MNKTEREELRRLLRVRFKLLRTDVEARQLELLAQLSQDIEDQFTASDKAYDDAMYRLKLAQDEANRIANDIGRELWGAEKWGVKSDRLIFALAERIPNPGSVQRAKRLQQGSDDIARRVKAAKLELERQENQLLTDLATSALESAEAQQFFARIPSVSALVPSYRLHEVGSE